MILISKKKIKDSKILDVEVRKKIIPINNFEKLSKIYKNLKKPEVELLFDENNLGKISIHINKNETLSKERLEISKIYNSLYNNIIIIFIDAISRQQFLRSFPKTVKFLKKFVNYKNNKGFSTFEFLKYHTFRPLTDYNVVPMFYGKSFGSGKGTNIIKNYKEKGYITAFSGSFGDKEVFFIDMKNKTFENMDFDSFDHENIAMYIDKNNYEGKFRGPSSFTRRCLYQKDVYEYNFDYGNDFLEKYKNNKKFLRLYFLDAHEPTNEVVKYLDSPLYNFLLNCYKKKDLENTAIMILSDHGSHFPSPYLLLLSEDIKVEKHYGLLFILLSNKRNSIINNDLIYKNIRDNSQILITPYDIYFTLLHISTGQKITLDKNNDNNINSSLFLQINRKERKCENYIELRNTDFCMCISKKRGLR